MDERGSLFKSYYSLNINEKNLLLYQCIKWYKVKRHRKNAIKHKTNSFAYSVKLPDRIQLVCKRALCSIYQISNKKIEIIQKKNDAW